MPEADLNDKLVVFFDGHCRLCDRFVGILLFLDRNRRLNFSPLQGELANRVLSERLVKEPTTVVVYSSGHLDLKDDALIRIGRELGGVWSFFATLFELVPRVIRSRLYDLVAKYRFAMLGQRETCRLPTVKERERFL